MSDEWIEDDNRDNAGHPVLADTLMAHSQRRQQQQSLEAPLQHQANEEEKEAVRQLRVLMAEVGGDLKFLSSRGDFKGSPQGIRRDYAMAVLLSKLALVHSHSDSLSDLSDLKELIALENLAQELVAKHFVGRHPLQVARSKWREIEAWMQAVEHLKQEVKKQSLVVSHAAAWQVPSKGKLVEMQRKLEDDLAKLTKRVQAQVDCLPVEVAVNGVILFELTELAAMDDLSKGQKSSRSALFAKSWEEVGVTKRSIQPGMTGGDDLQPRLLQPMESALADLRRWQDRFTEHEQRLQRLAKYLATGRLSAAKVSGRKLGQLRFAELNYQPLTDLKTLESALKELERAKPGKATRLIKELRAKHSKAGAHTELIQLLNRHQARAASKKRQVLILALLMLGLITFAGKFVGGGLREAEDERLAFERIVDQAKARLSKDVQSGAIDGKLEIPLSASVSAQFCFIPSGSFTMGSPSGEEGRSRDEGQVEVTLSQLFWLAKTEVTQAQWEAVMGSNPSYFKGNQLPVENVSWEEAQAFIAKLNKMQMLPQGWRFALPTEAQWEYACRAGEKGPYSGGSLDQLGWYDGNSGRKSHEVGQKHPNAWGLYDMHGNVLEWCVDRYADTLQGGEDPRGPELGVSRVCRGGCWSLYASSCRAALRLRNYPGNRFSSLGFRPALVPSE